jgi:hypothetical protein
LIAVVVAVAAAQALPVAHAGIVGSLPRPVKGDPGARFRSVRINRHERPEFYLYVNLV